MSEVGRFETEMLSTKTNIKKLMYVVEVAVHWLGVRSSSDS